MATPTLVSGLTDWELFDGSPSTTNIGGGAGPSTSTDVVRQGSQSIGRKANTTGRYGFAVSVTSVDFSVTDRYLWIWWNVLYSPNQLTTRAGGGVRILVGTGGTTNYWEYSVGGNDFSPDGTPVVAGKWYRSCIDIANATPSATGGAGATLTGIDYIGITVNYTSTPSGNLLHFYMDGAQYGSGYQFTGGTSGDPVTMDDISTYSEASSRAWGLAQFEQGAYFCNGKITVGNGATATYFDDDGLSLFYRPQEYYDGTSVTTAVSADFNGINATGAGADFVLANSSITSVGAYAADRFEFDSSSPNSLTIEGSNFTKAATMSFYSGQSITASSFSNCNQLVPSSSTFTGNTIKNYVGTEGGALLWPGGTTVNSCNFVNNDESIEITTGTSHTFQALTFDDVSGKFDVNNTSGSAVTVSKTSGSNPNSYTGSSTTFTASFSHTLTGMAANTEVTYVLVSDGSVVFHVEDVDGTGETEYVHGGGENVDILIHHINYLPDISGIYNITLPNSDASIQIQQFDDPNYINP